MSCIGLPNLTASCIDDAWFPTVDPYQYDTLAEEEAKENSKVCISSHETLSNAFLI